MNHQREKIIKENKTKKMVIQIELPEIMRNKTGHYTLYMGGKKSLVESF
jgi:hypothetical protein